MMRIGKYIPTRNTAAAFREHVEKAKEQNQAIEAITSRRAKGGGQSIRISRRIASPALKRLLGASRHWR